MSTIAAIALAKGIADATGLTDWVANKFGDSAPVAKAIIDTAIRVSGASSANDVIAVLQQDQTKAAEVARVIKEQELEYFRLRNEHELNLRDKDTADLKIVNDTFITELQNSDKEAWYQKAWRPANGFCVAGGSFVGVIAVCILMWKAIVEHDINGLMAVPQLAMAVAMILAVPGAAVGITAWKRGVAQIEEIKRGGT